MTNFKYQINSKSQIPNIKQYDLESRTLDFGKRIIRMCKALPRNIINSKLISQVVRSGTSVGANYREANETETKKDFRYRIRICIRESKETVYWLNLIIEANPEMTKKIDPLLQEAKELVKIFAAILEKCK